jgi:hypothetical protein
VLFRSSSTMITEVRLLIVYIIVDVNVILVMNFFPLHALNNTMIKNSLNMFFI